MCSCAGKRVKKFAPNRNFHTSREKCVIGSATVGKSSKTLWISALSYKIMSGTILTLCKKSRATLMTRVYLERTIALSTKLVASVRVNPLVSNDLTKSMWKTFVSARLTPLTRCLTMVCSVIWRKLACVWLLPALVNGPLCSGYCCWNLRIASFSASTKMEHASKN